MYRTNNNANQKYGLESYDMKSNGCRLNIDNYMMMTLTLIQEMNSERVHCWPHSAADVKRSSRLTGHTKLRSDFYFYYFNFVIPLSASTKVGKAHSVRSDSADCEFETFYVSYA